MNQTKPDDVATKLASKHIWKNSPNYSLDATSTTEPVGIARATAAPDKTSGQHGKLSATLAEKLDTMLIYTGLLI